MFTKLLVVLNFIVLSMVLSNIANCDEANGKTIYTSCAACHGANGEGNIAFKSPNLTGLEKWYFAAQINKFKTGVRGAHADDTAGKLMAPMAQLLKTEQDIEDVFKYIQTIKKDTEVKPTLGGDATKGKALYNTCLACHGDKGQGMEVLKAPSFKKQEDWYIVEQLTKFKKDVRGSHEKDAEGKLMVPMAKTLADEAAMKDVAAYILTLK
jgi:cytochrome c oxidase subunit 2